MYPVLDTKKGGSVTPLGTYVIWDDHFNENDQKLMCIFYLRNDLDFKKFEKISLFGNELFHSFYEGEEGVGIYVFDFSKYHIDWKNFIQGKYSKLSFIIKDRIKRYFNNNNANAVYVDSFLNPVKYYDIYSRLLNVKIDTLKGGELCDCPNFEKERLKMSVKSVEIRNSSLDLPKL